jgi:DNA repair ATPase RecN
MNAVVLKQAILDFLEKRDAGKQAINPFQHYYESDTQETLGEKESFIEHMYSMVLKDLQEEFFELSENKAMTSRKLQAINEAHQRALEETMHIDSILKKIHELKRLHAITQTEAEEMFPETTPELLHLNTLERKAEELQANIDQVNKEMSGVQKCLDESRQKLDEKIRDYEEKKSQEEHKLELLVVIQNVVRKKREQIVERNATLVQLKREIEELKVPFE